jgi:dynein heavy chain
MQSWLKTLERSLELIEDFELPDFRCLLTSEPPNAMFPLMEIVPESILQKCVKATDEAPQDIKSNLRRTWNKFNQDTIDKSSKPREFKPVCLGFVSSTVLL